MKKIDYFDKFDEIIELIKKGVFLTVKSNSDLVNTMTIGWSLLGWSWRSPIMMVAVRPSRYTFQLIEDANDFTVTIPFSNMSEQLRFCGTHSGSKCDKLKESGLVIEAAQKVKSPIIKTTGRFYECKIVQSVLMDESRLDKGYDKIYPYKAYHTLYFGEILACYETE